MITKISVNKILCIIFNLMINPTNSAPEIQPNTCYTRILTNLVRAQRQVKIISRMFFKDLNKEDIKIHLCSTELISILNSPSRAVTVKAKATHLHKDV